MSGLVPNGLTVRRYRRDLIAGNTGFGVPPPSAAVRRVR
jgi:hypothetical protein